MRIAYISLHWPRTSSSGVGKKIFREVSAWNKDGHAACLFMHTSEHPLSELVPAEIFSYNTNSNRIDIEFSRVNAARRLVRAVGAFQPDLIYFRYGMYVHPINQLASIAPIVEELNTDDLLQHKELGWIYDTYNRLTRGIVLRRTKALIFVSNELARSSSFAKFNKPGKTIANGINLADFTPLPPPSNSNPRLIFIGTPDRIWHGVDKLETFARLYPDLRIDIIGYDNLPENRPAPSNMFFHGFLSSDGYRMLLASADVAISSLALHRIGLQEASTLKSREYLAYGLPLILSYIDTDLQDLSCNFLLNIPNTEDNLETHGPLIREFAYKMRGIRVDRQLIAPRIDTEKKETERLKFFAQFI